MDTVEAYTADVSTNLERMLSMMQHDRILSSQRTWRVWQGCLSDGVRCEGGQDKLR